MNEFDYKTTLDKRQTRHALHIDGRYFVYETMFNNTVLHIVFARYNNGVEKALKPRKSGIVRLIVEGSEYSKLPSTLYHDAKRLAGAYDNRSGLGPISNTAIKYEVDNTGQVHHTDRPDITLSDNFMDYNIGGMRINGPKAWIILSKLYIPYTGNKFKRFVDIIFSTNFEHIWKTGMEKSTIRKSDYLIIYKEIPNLISNIITITHNSYPITKYLLSNGVNMNNMSDYELYDSTTGIKCKKEQVGDDYLFEIEGFKGVESGGFNKTIEKMKVKLSDLLKGHADTISINSK